MNRVIKHNKNVFFKNLILLLDAICKVYRKLNTVNMKALRQIALYGKLIFRRCVMQ